MRFEWKGGGVPFGYAYNQQSTTLEVETKEAEVLQTIFDLASKGVGVVKIAETLNLEKIKPRRGRRWTATVISAIIHPARLRFYLGYSSNETKGNWTPLIKEAIANKITGHRAPAFATEKKSDKSTFLLSGKHIFACAYCGGRVKASVTIKDDKKTLYYLCAQRQTAGISQCPNSKLHRQETIDSAVLTDLRVKIQNENAIKRFAVKKQNVTVSQLQEQTETLFTAIKKELRAHNVLAGLDKMRIFADEAREEITKIFDPRNVPSGFTGRTPEKTILANIKEIKLFNDYLVIDYHYPINELLETEQRIAL